MKSFRKIISIVLAIWMLAISNGILFVQHYFHGKLNTVSLFVAEEDGCSSHLEEGDDCCTSGCACHHEAETLSYSFEFVNMPALEQAEESCCFEDISWLHLDNTFYSATNLSIPLELNGLPLIDFSSAFHSECINTFPTSYPPPILYKVSKPVLFSTFLC